MNLKCICMNCFGNMEQGGDCPFCGYDNLSNRGKYVNAIEAGSIIHGNLLIGRVLGQGGFGITYVGKRLTDQKKVAVKEFFPQGMAARKSDGNHITVFTGEKAEHFRYGADKFLEEAKTLGKMRGIPGIVEAESYFTENGTAYLVMEYVEGISLKNYITYQGGKLSYNDALRIICPIMLALERVHRTGCVHRDVTPDNIYIMKDGRIKLLDFGSARFCLGDRSQSLDVVLKAGYAPPEQYKRRGKQGAYTDVYSLAACLYASITGYLPPDAMKRQEKDTLLPVSQMRISIPAVLDHAIIKGLSLEAAGRYRNMREFYNEIQSLVTAQNVMVSREQRPEQEQPAAKETDGSAAVPAQSRTETESGRQQPSGKAARILITAVVLTAWLALVIIMLILFTN